MRLFFAVLITAAGLAANPDQCRSLEKHGKKPEARACFLQLTRSGDPFMRAEGHYGLRAYKAANDQFRLAVQQQPKNPDIRVRWGRMLVEPFNRNTKDAADLFSEALEIKKDHAGALMGLALAASGSFEAKAEELARKALEADPKNIEAHELIASMALEDSNTKKAVEEADAAIKISPEALDALAIRAAVEIIADRPAEEWLKRIYQVNPGYGEAHLLIGHHLVLNRRYDEAIAHFRQAIKLDPENLHAQSQLGIQLMRTGQDQEALRLLNDAHDRGFREASTTNSLKLLDSLRNFLTFKTDTTVVKLHKKEAALLRVYMEEELRKCIRTFEKKYKMKLPRPVQLEVYPDHEDFAVRTMGMPGVGILGVTFGDVVAMDSPSGRPPGSFHWASTLWHEMSHVFVLVATKHRVPRWFTEGLAVHEETATNPEWGDRLTPSILAALRDKKLLPVAELDRGFIRPKYEAQVVVSYFQAGKICDYINEKWGYDTLLAMMHSFGARKTTPEVIELHLKLKPEEFDKQFLAWLDGHTKKTVDGFGDWTKKIKQATQLKRENKLDEAVKLAVEARDLYPDYIEAANAYELLADAYEAKKDKKSAAAELLKYAKMGGRDPKALKRLSQMQEELGDPRGAAATLARINYVYPVNDEPLHRRFGDLLFNLKDYSGALREYSAVLAMSPLDRASAHHNVARTHLAMGDRAKAEDSLLEALEAAPNYRPAQKLLLELEAQKKEKP
ncbi:MAG: tetratricopeptide repeat protein [Acidobacteria bacterium]|nr:tetratricopeptide repeat protein [Acidobacteriota bacterium]